MASLPSNAAWLTAIRALDIAGVKRKYDYPPASINAADLYCTFPLLPDASRGERVSTCIEQSKQRSIGFVLIVEPVAQDTQANNYDKLTAAMDNLETALDGLAPNTVNFVDYTIAANGNYQIGNIAYWAIVADITGRSL